MWFLCFTRSRTTTVPLITRVVVPEQLSFTRYFVPRTVAVEWRPRGWERPLPRPGTTPAGGGRPRGAKRPFTLANRRRPGRRRAACTPADPARARGRLQSRLKLPPPIITAVVSGEDFVCFVRNTPFEN